MQNGSPVPVLLGEFLCAGDLIEAFTRQISPDRNEVNLLFLLGHGEFQSIAGKTADEDDIDYNDSAIANKIHINDQPIQNFEGVKVSVRMGTPDQKIIPMGGEDQDRNTTIEVADGREIPEGQANAISYTTTQSVDGFRLKIIFPRGFFHYDRNGRARGISAQLAYRYRVSPAGSWTTVNEQLDFSFFVNPVGFEFEKLDLTHAVYDIEVWRSDTPAAGTSSSNDMNLSAIDEILNYSSSQPGSALLGIRSIANESLQGGIPNVQVVCEGVKAPTWSAGGGWTSTKTYTQNPAWLLAEMLTNSDWGGGNRWSLSDLPGQSWKDFADYCDVSVAIDQQTGAGSEPRHELNDYIVSPESLWALAVKYALNCNTELIIAGRKVKPKTDQSLADSGGEVKKFGMGQIVRGSFKTQYRRLEDRFNQALGTYRDQNSRYEPTPVQDEDSSIIGTGDPVIERSFDLRGITRESEARRRLKYVLNSSSLKTSTQEFRITEEGLGVEVGDLIGLAHDTPQYGLGSGRTLSATASSITLDRPVTLEPSTSYVITVNHDDNTSETATVSDSVATSSERTLLNISGTWTTTPSAGDPYFFGQSNLESKTVRVLSTAIDPVHGHKIISEIHNDSVFSVTPASISEPVQTPLPNPSSFPADITNWHIRERAVFLQGGSFKIVVDVTWQVPENYGIRSVTVWFRNQTRDGFLGGIFFIAGEVPSTAGGHFVIEDSHFGVGDEIDVALVPHSIFGPSKTIFTVDSKTITLTGNTSQIPDVDVHYAAPAISPTCEVVAGGVSGSRAYFVRLTYVTKFGETGTKDVHMSLPGVYETQISPADSENLKVTAPATFPDNVSAVGIYVRNLPFWGYYLQAYITTPGGTWTEPDSGHIAGQQRLPTFTSFFPIRQSDTGVWTIRWRPAIYEDEDDGIVIPTHLAGYQVRYGSTWTNSIVVAESIKGTEISTSDFPLDLPDASDSPHYIMVKAVDVFGRLSENEASVLLNPTASDDPRFLIATGRTNRVPDGVLTRSEAGNSWNGTTLNFTAGGSPSVLTLDTGETHGWYATDIVDIGRLARVNISVRVEIDWTDDLVWSEATFSWSDEEAERSWSIGSLPREDFGLAYEVEIRTVDDTLLPDPEDWSPWEKLVQSGEYECQRFQIRVKVASKTEIDVTINEIETVLDPPDIRDSGEHTTSSPWKNTINFNKTFRGGAAGSVVDPQITANIIGTNTAQEYVEITRTHPFTHLTSFDVRVLDNTGSPVTSARTIHWEALGV